MRAPPTGEPELRVVTEPMRLRTVTPHPDLAPFVYHFWIFESPRGLPAGDARIVVPNGRPKLIVPWRNGLTARRAADPAAPGHHHEEPVIIGQWEEPTVIASSPEPTLTVGVELNPHGLSRLFPVAAHELTARILPAADVLGPVGRALTQRTGDAATAEEAAEIVHSFLLDRLRAAEDLPAALQQALALLAAGPLPVQELERRSGWSRRYLHTLFLRYVGLPPKRLSTVLAFERMYRRFSVTGSAERLRLDALEIFYDQPHFIRTFRRFTGHAPGRFAELENEFGRVFYTNSQTYKTGRPREAMFSSPADEE